MDKTLTIKSKCHHEDIKVAYDAKEFRQGEDASCVQDYMKDMYKTGVFTHCLEIVDEGLKEDCFISSINIFTKGGQCSHSSVDECAEFLAGVNRGFWLATFSYLKERITKIVRNHSHAAILKYIEREPLNQAEKIVHLDRYIKWMIKEYPEYYLSGSEAYDLVGKSFVTKTGRLKI